MNLNKELMLKITSLSFLFILIIMTGALISKVNHLSNEISSLTNEVNVLRGRVNGINSDFQKQIDDLTNELEEQGKKYFNVSALINDYNEGMLKIELSFSLKEYYKGSEIKVIAENMVTHESSEFSTSSKTTNNFTSQLLLNYSDDIQEKYLISYQMETVDLVQSEEMMMLDSFALLKNRFQAKAGLVNRSEVQVYIKNEYLGNEQLKIKSAEVIIGTNTIDVTSYLSDEGFQEQYNNFIELSFMVEENTEIMVELKIIDHLGITYYFH